MTKTSCGLILLVFTMSIMPGWAEKEHKPQRPVIHAGDWVSAWKAARGSCPEATSLNVYFIDRSGPTLRDAKVFDCVDMKAVGELLVIVVKLAAAADESVQIVRGCDVIRIEVTRQTTDNGRRTTDKDQNGASY